MRLLFLGWRDIEEEMRFQFTNEQCSAKWQNLRNTFRKISQKKTKSGQGVENEPQWRFYKNMAFITANERQHTTESESTLDVSN